MSTIDDLPGGWAYLYDPKPTLGADGQKWTASLSFLIPQSILIPFVEVIAGRPESVSYSGGSVDRIVMLQHPIYDWLWSSSFQCESFGEASASSDELVDLHSHVKVHVQFSSPSYPTSGGEPYLTWETKSGGLYATIPNRKMKFSTGEVLGADAGVHYTQTAYVLTLYQCPTLNDAVLETFNGTINNAPFRGKPTGQLRFDSWGGSFQIGSGGVIQWTRQIMFTYQSHHWNKYFRTDGVLDTATDPAGNPTYGLADFTGILG